MRNYLQIIQGMDDQTIVLIETYGNLRILHFKKHHPYVKIVIFLIWKNNI